MSNNCETKFPILLAHGAGFRDDSPLFNYWGRIPEALEKQGAKIFYAGQDAWGTIEANAAIMKSSIERALLETGAEKVNIIAHSRGGLESRYMIRELDMSARVASLTTISTPHHGSKVIDIVYGLPKFLYRIVSFFVNFIFKVLGDRNPDFYNGSRQLSSFSCEAMNERCTPDPKVYYQSYACKMRNPFSDMILFLPNLIVSFAGGDNDGIVTVESSRYENFKGVIQGTGLRGVSHADAVDLRRCDHKSFDIIEVYRNIVRELKEMGF
jgi:triacylglycerol lipase